ncbi:TetR/AcrR family transcriptional regulator [Cellulomonas sp. HZM]|uniref:TetR/AcrR family transcriptional regulator n=1 Tax=Cellulomonas sp. HZM TaxID=1454010 RepID=UPI00055098F5|nr:TetR/AcrR family transcriptional regulator [Cellulomonas sp. HZM]
MTDRRPALRRDAERNRTRIVCAARELFAERGLGVGFNEVAHRAGVGVGTVYRRFADKPELVRAALEEPLDALVEVAARADEAARAWDGLELLLVRITDLLVDNLGLRDAALGGGAWELAAPATERIAEVMERLLARAHDEGDLRAGAGGEDVVMLLWLVTTLAEHAAEVRPALHRRYLQVLLDGLRSGPGRAALPEPLGPADVDAISRRWAAS